MGKEVVGLMRHRVALQQRIPGSGSAGEPTESFWTVYERWARIEALQRTTLSQVESDTRLTARRWRVTLRAGPVVTLDMRILWRGLILRLTGLENDPEASGHLVLLAEELGA